METKMKEKTEKIASESFEHSQPDINAQTLYGWVLRYHHCIWEYPHWEAHQRVQAYNTYILSTVEQHSPAAAYRNPRGCEALFQETGSCVETAIQALSFCKEKKIPVQISIYKDISDPLRPSELP